MKNLRFFLTLVFAMLITGAATAAPAPFYTKYHFIGEWKIAWENGVEGKCTFHKDGSYEEYYGNIRYVGKWHYKNSITYVSYKNTTYYQEEPYHYELKWLTKTKAYNIYYNCYLTPK